VSSNVITLCVKISKKLITSDVKEGSATLTTSSVKQHKSNS